MQRSSRSRARGLFIPLSLALFLLTGATSAKAGPWSHKSGHFYLKLEEGFFVADRFRNSSGQIVEGVDYLSLTTSLYAEVGIYQGLQVAGRLPLSWAQNSFPGGFKTRSLGGGDALISFQYAPVWKALTKFSMRVELSIPMLDIATIPDPTYPAFSDGQLDATFWLSVGHGFLKVPLFLFAEVGYRHRSETYVGRGSGLVFGDGITLLAGVGYTIAKRVLMAVTFGGILSFKPGVFTKSFLSLGTALGVRLWKGLSLEARFDPVVYAVNSSPGFGWGVGLSYKH